MSPDDISKKSPRQSRNRLDSENKVNDEETEQNYYHYYHVITAAV